MPARPGLSRVAASAACLLVNRLAEACPNCAVGRQARAEVFDADFPRYLAMTLLPFGVIALVAVIAYGGLRPPRLRLGRRLEAARD